MDVSTMFYICRYCVFTLWGRLVLVHMFYTFAVAYNDYTKHIRTEEDALEYERTIG